MALTSVLDGEDAFKELKIMKKFLSVLLISALMMTAAGCTEERRTEAEEEEIGYGEEIFVCNPGNFLGFEAAYANGDTVTLLFDEDATEPYYTIPGVMYDFTRGYMPDDNYIEVYAGDESYQINGDDVDIDKDEQTMTFEVDEIEAEDITSIRFYRGDTYVVDFSSGRVEGSLWIEAGCQHVYQEYDFRGDTWGELICDPIEEPCEPTPVVDPNAQTGVQLGVVGGFITPYMAEYTPDEFVPEYNEYLFGMIDLDGNVIYDPQFTSVQYVKNCGAYIVGGEVDGVTRYGIMNDDGEEFTGLIYDGAFYDIGMTENESGHFYMTTYADGILHVTTYEDDLVLTDDDIDITIDEDALPYEAKNLGVCHMAMNGALIRDCSQFYPHNVLIDVETGEVLHDFADSFGDEILFGDYIIVSNIIRETVQICTYDGDMLFDGDDAVGFMLDTYRYALAYDGVLVVFDREGAELASLDIASNAVVDQGCGVIGVTDAAGTIFYDEDLNVIASDSNIYLDDGYLSGRFSSGWGNNIIFVSFSRDTVTNVVNGAVMDADDSCFYSHERDYIFADDISDGNLPEHHWYLYDNEFNLLLTGDDYGDVIYDEFTDDMYVTEFSDGVTTIYSLDTFEPVFSIDGRYTVSVMNGEFMLTGSTDVGLYAPNGDVIFSSVVVSN